ncbi:HAD family phosphatase [soil metagenome]
MLTVRAAIFDFNGTLSDDEPILYRVFSALTALHFDHELTERDYFDRLAGRSDREIIDLLVAECRPGLLADERRAMVDALLDERREMYRHIVAESCPILPGTEALVKDLVARNIPLAIVTGAQRPDVLHVLAHSPLTDVFAHIVTEEDVTHGKPDPEGFLIAARLLGADPSDILVCEDSIAGVRAAKAAGMHVVAVTGTHDKATLEAETDLVVDALSPEVLALL